MKEIPKPWNEMTWQECVKQWDKGEAVWSAELGGIGPGYEQTIQILLWEIMSRWGDRPLPKPLMTPEGARFPDAWEKHVDQVVRALDKDCLGFSGAQVGAAKGTAWQFMTHGYAEMMGKLEQDRHILVSKNWPKAPAPAAPKGSAP